MASFPGRRVPPKGNQKTRGELKLLGPDDRKRKQTKERVRQDKHHFTSVKGKRCQYTTNASGKRVAGPNAGSRQCVLGSGHHGRHEMGYS